MIRATCEQIVVSIAVVELCRVGLAGTSFVLCNNQHVAPLLASAG
jgi:hypothetical protein